ncbi:MAG: hypothetical protein M3444_12525 [Acidobacteriota bacterium]|nr:hypothetical protein [Acidobacteriota bacterium]MDQ5836880.1 hypothetical protein [Acidobacteriota bacterium]
MIKKLSRNLVAAAAIVVAAAGVGVAGLAPITDSSTSVVNPPPGQRRCKDLSTKAYNNASIDDLVTNGHKVIFTFYRKPDLTSDYTEISNSGPEPVSSYSTSVNAQSNPKLFPGYFRTCARNPSQKPTTDSLTITVDR